MDWIISSTLAVGHVTRFYSSTELTKQLIVTGFLGTLLSFDYEFGTEGGWAPLSGYNLSRGTSGGGVLVVSGSHFIERMIHVFGLPELLEFSHDARGGVEANCLVKVNCKVKNDLFEGRIALSKTHLLANRLQIQGEKGRLLIGETQSESVSYFPSDREIRQELFLTGDGDGAPPDYFRIQLEDFVTAIHRKRER